VYLFHSVLRVKPAKTPRQGVSTKTGHGSYEKDKRTRVNLAMNPQ